MFSDGTPTLWVERGFSRRKIVPRMQAAVPNLNIISTRVQPIGGTLTVDYPDLSTPDGVTAANKLIGAYGVDALWPQRSAQYDLGGVNAEVHVAGTPEVIALVDDKACFAEWLGSDPFRADTSEVSGAAGVASEYVRRRARGEEVCVKPVIGVNGEGYWRLTEEVTPSSFLIDPECVEMHPEIYVKAMELHERETDPLRLIVMEWLPGPEVSVDMLCWHGTALIHAARTKFDGGVQRIQSEHVTIPHAYKIAEELGLHGLVSVQYRLSAQGIWKILEVNPRPAGGSIYSEDAGFGVISGWARLVAKLADPSDLTQHQGDVMFSVDSGQ